MATTDDAHDVLVTEFCPLAEEAFNKAEHREIWGIEFPTNTDDWTAVHRGILIKFVTAKPTVTEAAEQLTNTLKWRKQFRPLDAAYNETHSHLYEPLGIITPATSDRPAVTWNLYGAVDDPSTVFADLDAFLRWRVGLMERGIAQLDFSQPERSIMDQVHDYMNVSFLRMNPAARKGSQAVVQVFQDYYPELLRAKYFVNIPLLMMWVFKFVRMRMDAKTADKFHVVHNGPDLASHLGQWVPKTYGGSGKPLHEQSISKEEIKSHAAAQGKDTTEAPSSTKEDKEESAKPVATATDDATDTAAVGAGATPGEVTPAPESTQATTPADPVTAPTAGDDTQATSSEVPISSEAAPAAVKTEADGK